MRKTAALLIIILLISGILSGAIPRSNRTWVRAGALQTPFEAWGAERGHDPNLSMYVGLVWPAWYDRTDNFVIDRQFVACRNFTDASGNVLNYKSAKFHTEAPATQLVPMVLEQSGRYPYCEISVDGVPQYYEDFLNDNIEAGQVADRIVTNVVRTNLGVTMTRKVYAYSQQYHDNYFIYEYTFENTGNIDDDDEIELNNTIYDFYFGIMSRYCTCREARYVTNLAQAGWGAHQWVHHTPLQDDPEIPYYYTWLGQAKTNDITMTYDNIGVPVLPAEGTLKDARIRCPQVAGTAVLHADRAYNDPAHDNTRVRIGWYIGDSVPPEGADQQAWMYLSNNYEDLGHFDVPQDVYAGHKVADRYPPFYTANKDAAGTNGYLSFGPYDIPVGESVRIVLCEGVAGINRRKAIEVGKNWYKAYTGQQADLELPPAPQYRDPEPVAEDAAAMDVYKNMWIYTGKDSIIKTFQRAKETFENDYVIPMNPPPPLSFNILPQPDNIILEWDNNPMEDDPDFEGYRLYRAMLEADSFYHCIFDGSISEGNVNNRFEDRNLLRGINYYYYVVSYKIDPVSGLELESGRAYTQTTIPTSLKKPPRDVTDDDVLISDIARDYAAGRISDKERIEAVLGMIRIVPNPFHIKNRKITFGAGVDKDKLMFYNLPENCQIRIFSERGDLVNVIEHVTGEGQAAVADEAWYSNTQSRQVIKSGIYIAHIRVTKDIAERETGLPLLKENDSIIKKFIVVR